MPDLDYVKVIGRFGIVVGDGSDPDEYPDTIWCDQGTVQITPLIPVTRVPDGDPVPWTGGQHTISAGVDDDGHLTWLERDYLWVVDLTSEKVFPRVPADAATHRLDFKTMKANNITVEFPTVFVRLAADVVDPETGAIDLTDAMPIATSTTPVGVFRGPTGVGIEDVTVVGDNLEVELDNGETKSTPLPVTMLDNAEFMGEQIDADGTPANLAVIAQIDETVPPLVTAALADDDTVAQAAADAVENGLDAYLTASDKLARLYAASATIGFQSSSLVDNRAGTIGNSGPATRRFILNSPIAANTVIESVSWYAKFAISAQYIELWKFDGDSATLVQSAGPFNLSTVGEHTIPLNWLTGDGSYRVAFRSAGTTNGTLMTGAPTNAYLYSEALGATSYTISTGLTPANLSLYVRVKVLRAVPGDTIGKTHTVSPTPGSANFTTIQGAVNAAVDGDTILIYPGTYREQVAAWGKHNLHFVGLSRDNVIIIDSSGAYSTPPLEIDSGSVRNLTIIEDHATAGTNEAAFEDQRAYGIHPDYPDQAGRTLIIEDCTIRNTRRTAIGCGLWQDNTVIVRRCDIWAGAPTLGGDRNRGAVYFHNRQSSTTVTTNQHLILEDNKIVCADAKAFYLYDSGLGAGMQQSVMDVLAIRNMIYSEVNGKVNQIGGTGFSDNVTLHPASYGNNIPELNA